MNLLEQVRHIPHGVAIITEWLGSGGEVVDRETAQARANVCIDCPNNVSGFAVTNAVARAVHRHLEVKNKLGLRVNGAKKLNTCKSCGCVLNLLIWQPQPKVSAEVTDEERPKLPSWCWKLK